MSYFWADWGGSLTSITSKNSLVRTLRHCQSQRGLMRMTLCTILIENCPLWYFRPSYCTKNCRDSAIRVRIPLDPKKIQKIFFLHFFYINTMYIIYTGCSIREYGLVFTLCVFRQLWSGYFQCLAKLLLSPGFFQKLKWTSVE